jgi:hypothetical protein
VQKELKKRKKSAKRAKKKKKECNRAIIYRKRAI